MRARNFRGNFGAALCHRRLIKRPPWLYYTCEIVRQLERLTAELSKCDRVEIYGRQGFQAFVMLLNPYGTEDNRKRAADRGGWISFASTFSF